MDDNNVYLNRPWINHSTNSFSGWTITVKAATGAIIVSALAILVRIAGESLWNIIAFTLHQTRATPNLETALFRQIQVILRNPTTSITSALELMKTGSTWHGKVDRARRKAFGLAFWPLTVFISFTIAGILVAKVTIPAYETSQILLRPTDCGLLNDNLNSTDYMLQLSNKEVQDARKSRTYAAECYGDNSNALGCLSLPRQQLPYTVDLNFTSARNAGNMSAVPSVVTLDTGYLNSHYDLGINAKESDRIYFQFQTSCSVLNYEKDVEPYIELEPDKYAHELYPLKQLFFGGTAASGSVSKYTWQYETVRMVRDYEYSIA